MARSAQKRRYLPKLISGEHVGALAMSEPGAGSDVVSMQLKAIRHGDRLRARRPQDVDHQRARGRRAGGVRQDRARIERARHQRLHHREGTSRVSRPLKSSTSSGMRGSSTSELVFDDCEVPADNLLGTENHGVNVLMRGLDYERVVLSGGPLGIMAAALDVAVPYVRERKQFGQADRHLRTGAGQARRHVCLVERLPQLRVHGGIRLRSRRLHPQRCRRLHIVLRRSRDPRLARCDSAPGRQRLHQRLPHGKTAARRQALRDRRRDLGNTPHADRPRTVRRRLHERSVRAARRSSGIPADCQSD